jgi:glutamine amidotransferase/cyclase
LFNLFTSQHLENHLEKMPKVHLLDYAAGNIRSLVNAIEKLGWKVEWIQSPSDVAKAEVSDFDDFPFRTRTDS